ncbi:MAG TPA: hypothetical protein VH040_11635 [Usitatibacter sp.]|jgi:hypothetical protein|nr:hypothetical protein [Usitatibacter sp.]
MISTFKRHAVALLAALAVSLPAAATSTGIDYTDQWWGGPAESGWGVNFIEQGTTIFATLFVYGPDQTPRWYVSTMQGSGTAFSGPMYSTTGPYFGAGAFNAASVTVAQVGTMSVNFSNGYNGALSYSVNGVNVGKSILRQSFANNNLTGHYLGGLTANGTNCQNSPNGAILIFDTMTVTQSGQATQMVVNFFAGNGQASQCVFNGTLNPQGVLGQISDGAFNCTVGGGSANSGRFTLDTISATQTGFSGIFNGSDQFCTYSGFFGGTKDVQ